MSSPRRAGLAWACMAMAAWFALPPPPAVAQGPPIHTDTPIMLGLEGGGVRTFARVTHRNRLLAEGSEVADSLNRSVTTWVYPVAVPFNLTPRVQAGVIVPFVSRSTEAFGARTTGSGIGDVTVFAKTLVTQVDRRAETFRVAAKGSAKFPAGDESARVPRGTGTVDLGVSVVAGWVRGRTGLYAESAYARNGTSGGTDLGDAFGYNLAVGFRVLPTAYERYPQPQVNAYVELNGTVTGHSETGGASVADSGGAVLLVSPGVQYVGGRRWLLEAALQVPLVDRPNGTQLGTAWSGSLGARVLLF